MKKVFLTVNCLAINGWVDTEYTLLDIIEDSDVDYPVVITCEEYGTDWRGFIRVDEYVENTSVVFVD